MGAYSRSHGAAHVHAENLAARGAQIPGSRKISSARQVSTAVATADSGADAYKNHVFAILGLQRRPTPPVRHDVGLSRQQTAPRRRNLEYQMRAEHAKGKDKKDARQAAQT